MYRGQGHTEKSRAAQIIRKAQRRLVVLLRENIPFIHDNDDALARLVHIARDLRTRSRIPSAALMTMRTTPARSIARRERITLYRSTQAV